MRMLRWYITACLLAAVWGCELKPNDDAGPKSPGDNYYKLIVNGDVERYAPDKNYVVTLVGSQTHENVQAFTKFKIIAAPQNPNSSSKQGTFHLFADTLTTFDDDCLNQVIQFDDLPKTEVQVMWKAPKAGSGCVLLKAMVYENDTRWFAEDGQLTKLICEDTSIHASECCACDDAKYNLVFEGLWSAQRHPKDFPVQALWLTHFSDVIGATHVYNFSFWGEGLIATDGFRSLAEWGSPGLLERELRQNGTLLRSIVKAQGLWYPKVNSNTSTTFVVDRKRPLLSLASMFGPSPDWVVGVNGLNLCQKDCTWSESKIVELYPYDAGTDNGISYMSPNAETVPREKMYRITTMYPEDPRAPFYKPGSTEIPSLARLYITKEKTIPRACDETELLELVALEDTEKAQAANRPECGVTAWSDWSACTVTCGKGLRMRTRQYIMPQKAQMFSCEMQLVSKEMCVAAVPECGDNNNPEPNDLDMALTPIETNDGICQTSEWGGWSECSVTCGIGMRIRRRYFLNKMGSKKCPLVNVEETQKCMEPQCTDADLETSISDPTCPTADWNSWSPCSVTCGRGIRFRTRLLLVPADKQQECASRVELMQQRPCTEKADCTFDMVTAKRICMSDADQGPCRGVYQRWTFMAQKGMCVPFNYGGCRGNKNNFLTQEDCMETCKVMLGGDVPAASSTTQARSSKQTLPAAAFPAHIINYQRDNSSSNKCEVSGFGPWSPCSATCGRGFQQKTRTILKQPGPGGAACPRLVIRRQCNISCE